MTNATTEQQRKSNRTVTFNRCCSRRWAQSPLRRMKDAAKRRRAEASCRGRRPQQRRYRCRCSLPRAVPARVSQHIGTPNRVNEGSMPGSTCLGAVSLMRRSHLMARCSCRFWFWRRWLYLRFPDGVTLPGAALPGFCVLRSASMKMKWSGGAAQSNCVP